MTTSFSVKSLRPNHQAVRVERLNPDGTRTPVRVLGFGESHTSYVFDGQEFVVSEAPLDHVTSLHDEREYTIAERMAGVPFNPGNNSDVANCKEEFAACISRMLAAREASSDPEVKRMASIAITEMQTAQMWAVKALTWKS